MPPTSWADGDKKGGLAMQCDKKEYPGILAGLEGISGKKAVDSAPDDGEELGAKQQRVFRLGRGFFSPSSLNRKKQQIPRSPTPVNAKLALAADPGVARDDQSKEYARP